MPPQGFEPWSTATSLLSRSCYPFSFELTGLDDGGNIINFETNKN